MKTWIKLMLVGIAGAIGGFLSGVSIPTIDFEEDETTCIHQARKIASNMEKCEEQFEVVNRQALELAKVAKEAIAQRDALERKCALEFTQEAAYEEGAQQAAAP